MAMPHNLQLETVLVFKGISRVPIWHRDSGSVCPEVQRVFVFFFKKKHASKEELDSL